MENKSQPVKHPNEKQILLHLGPLGGLVFAVFMVAIFVLYFGAIAIGLCGLAVVALCIGAWEAFDNKFLRPRRQRKTLEAWSKKKRIGY